MMLWRGLRPATVLRALAALLDRRAIAGEPPPADPRARPAPPASPPPRDDGSN